MRPASILATVALIGVLSAGGGYLLGREHGRQEIRNLAADYLATSIAAAPSAAELAADRAQTDAIAAMDGATAAVEAPR